MPTPRDITATIAACGEAAASLAGYECVTERSPTTESTYLHIRRGEHWYGLRISCHSPAYHCCHDYEQLIAPRDAGETDVRRLSWLVARRAVIGGDVVANPRVVGRAIARLARRLVDGRRYRDAAGGRWRWSVERSAWTPDGGVLVHADPPTHRPPSPVTPRVRCEIRHAQNVVAKWAFEEARLAAAS